MDLADLKDVTNEGAEMVLKHPTTNEPIIDEETKQPWVIVLKGKDSPEWQRFAKSIADKRLSTMNTSEPMGLTADGLEKVNVDQLCACTVAFKHIRYGGPLEADEQGKRKLYALPWVREQANKFVNDRANFLGN
jgi:hypothetical protein